MDVICSLIIGKLHLKKSVQYKVSPDVVGCSGGDSQLQLLIVSRGGLQRDAEALTTHSSSSVLRAITTIPLFIRLSIKCCFGLQ